LTLTLGLGFGLGCSATGFGGSPRSPVPPGVSATAAASLPVAAIAPIAVDGVEPVTVAALGSLAVRKWALRNGLRIITAPDPSARSVSYVTTYRVGSRDEDAAAGQTGLAHFCEHLMFAGNRGASGPGAFDRRLEELGGNGNATTGYDFTSYTDELPPEALEAVIRLEAERMTSVDLTPEEIEREREIVIEERLQSSEDDIDGQLDELVHGQAFRSHPYRWPIVGRMADIRAATPASVTAFFARHYGPDHATVVIAGRFDEVAALSALAASYGPLPARPRTAEPVIVPERAPAGEVRATIARAVPADRLMVGQPAPGLGDPDRAAYEILDDLLTGGPSARLYRALMVDRELASSLEAEVAPTRDPGLWTIVVQMRKSERAAEAEDLIRREIARLIETPVPAAELSAARNRLETAFWLGLSSSEARAEQLGAFDTTTGDFRLLLERGAAYRRVTATDVSRVARAWLGTGGWSIVVARPRTGPGA
jgi:zinc protease